MTGPDGEISVPIRRPLQVDSAQGLRRAALAGMGIVMLPEIMLSEDVDAGRLVALLQELHAPTRPLNLLYLRDRRMSPKLRSFVDFAIERFGPAARLTRLEIVRRAARSDQTDMVVSRQNR
jgi:DNA-binding transcriptional LysR family regulator